jgi:hypothetical protein
MVLLAGCGGLVRAACIVVLAACGFHRDAITVDGPPGPGSDAAIDSDVIVDLSPICSSIMRGAPQFAASACATPTVGALVIATSASLDTDTGISTPPGITCVRTTNITDNLCAIVAPSIVIQPGVTLRARGSLPLALFAHSLTIRGTVDVASHAAGSVIGAGSYTSGCSAGLFPRLAGGGHGGGASGEGGQGGDQGGAASTGGTGGFSFAIDSLIGGCGGTRGGDGSAGGSSDGGTPTGGAGGGAVWLVSDTADLTLDATAIINASGAGGAGAALESHGGAGGGAGGLIVLQAPHIHLDPNALLFANGGHGGGGAGINSTQPGYLPGTAGTDPAGPTSGGTGGTGGVDGSNPVLTSPLISPNATSTAGDGGAGYPATATERDGRSGGTTGRGGGGGGGGEGAIRVVSATFITGSNISPPPVYLQ